MNWNSSKEYPLYMTAVEGIIPEAEYQALLKGKWKSTPLDFHGYNNYPDYWPFWSSEPYTYVTNMLALAKFSNTYESVDEPDHIGGDISGRPIVY